MEIKKYVKMRKEQLKSELDSLNRPPHLVIFSVGEDPASKVYIRGKMKDSVEVGFDSEQISLLEETTQHELLKMIREKNNDDLVDGILVQLPLPKHIDSKAVNATINPSKDVDGFVNNSKYVCCTPKGIVDYLSYEGFDFDGKNAVIIGRSQIVGKPMSKLLLNKNCNVTILHSHTSREDMGFYVKHADLIVVAVGVPKLLDSSFDFKPSAVVVDVGINRNGDGKLCGDCEKDLPVSLQTPVPGGVGLLTRLALLDNLWEAYKNNK